MHSFHGDNVVIHHNGDYSGECIIRQENQEIRMNTSDLLDFVAEYVRSQKIGQLEQMSSEDLLLK